MLCGHFRLPVQQLAFSLCTLSLVPCQLPRTPSLIPAQWLGPCTPAPPALRLCLEVLCQPVGGAPGCLCGTLAKPPATCHLFSVHCTACKLVEHPSVSTTDSHPSPWNRFSFQAGSTSLENVPSQTHYCPLGLSSPSETEQKKKLLK